MNIIKEKKFYIFEETIKKSKFITYIATICNRSEFERFIEKYKRNDAKHNCWAYRYGTNNNIKYGYNNDGEPTGTAGEPLLKLIEINNLTNVIIFCVRYYGGIKLGTGGLQRAYSNGAIQLLKEIEIKPLELLYLVKIKFNISNIKNIKLTLHNLKVEYSQEFLNDDVFFTFKIEDLNKLEILKQHCTIVFQQQDYF
ncbi:IMPACT family protein [Spiroplasma tabanidicola]|uniref:YigZ family protein n=1 Tax=Spiroplasma tabanidicola TaxID=324079 RepID=A0A6I6C5U3_9MOLU|nr:YigZ family protein [Spiroplasma tabanidicola]QGS51510.1 YigZ family protein [Spiroplasma tabanidicola]